MAKVDVLFFGSLAERFGKEMEVEIPASGCTIAQLWERVAGQGMLMQAEVSRPGVRALVGDEIVPGDFRLSPGQAVEFFPPLSGG